MAESDAIDLVQTAIWTILVASAPAILVAMVVGIAIALLQALTQVQELTLTFIPKIVAILVMCAITATFMGGQIGMLAQQLYGRIGSGF